MKLVAGLGNPGHPYSRTRHNIGFMVLHHFAARKEMRFVDHKLCQIAFWRNGILCLPQTYMNASGEAIAWCASEFPVNSILSISDDIHLPAGKIRIRKNGGDGGHNGLKSIIESLGTEDFHRIRIGVGYPGQEVRDFVLSPYDDEEMAALTPVLAQTADLIEKYIVEDFEAMLNEFSRQRNLENVKTDPGETGDTVHR